MKCGQWFSKPSQAPAHTVPTYAPIASKPDWFKWIVGGSLASIGCAALLFIASCGFGLFGLSQMGASGVDSAFTIGYCEYHGSYVAGEVVNVSDRTVTNVSADISVLDMNGNVVGSTMAFTNQVAPKQSWRFREYIGYAPGGASAKITSVRGL